MNLHRITVLTFAAALAMAGGTAFAETGIKTGDSTKGEVLTDQAGMTLYTFDKDKDGMSVCYNGCARNWPPLLAPAGAEADGDFGLTTRKDGSKQWTYYDMPLYLWIKDKAPGDVTGDGKGGVWHIAVPQE